MIALEHPLEKKGGILTPMKCLLEKKRLDGIPQGIRWKRNAPWQLF